LVEWAAGRSSGTRIVLKEGNTAVVTRGPTPGSWNGLVGWPERSCVRPRREEAAVRRGSGASFLADAPPWSGEKALARPPTASRRFH